MKINKMVDPSSKLCGVVFIALTNTGDNLSPDMAFIAKEAQKRKARIIGMLSGLLQIIIDGQSQEVIQINCNKFVDDVMAFIQERGIAVWTIQKCLVGCWGDENWVNYGVLIPNLQQVASFFASADPGQKIKV